MNTSTIQGSDILKLIPQRPPVVMVDAFYGIEEGVSHSGLTILDSNIFCAGGHLREPGIIEHIAQSAAARMGFIFMQKNEPVPLGYIGSVDKLAIHKLPELGSELRTRISIVQELGNLSLISAESTANGEPVAECRMKIFLNIGNEN